MKKLFIVCLAFVFAITLGFANAYAQMPSGKGSAAISDGVVLEYTPQTNSWDEVVSTYIKIAQDKELVFDVALECGLYTDTHVRSKGGTKDTQNAWAAINVRVKVERLLGDGTLGPAIWAHPDNGGKGVTYAKREQTLMAKFQGIFQECQNWEIVYEDDGVTPVIDPVTDEPLEVCTSYGTDTCLNVVPIDENNDGVMDDANGNGLSDDYKVTLDVDCLDYEEVQLILETVNANAFNFVSPNLDQGEYKVTVVAEITSNNDEANPFMEAKAFVGLGSMVVDEVRFIKNDVGQDK